MPFHPPVRAANTSTRACGSLAAGGSMWVLDQFASRQLRGWPSTAYSPARAAIGSTNTTSMISRSVLRRVAMACKTGKIARKLAFSAANRYPPSDQVRGHASPGKCFRECGDNRVPAQPKMSNPVLVEVTRGSLVESRHTGAVAVIDADGATML